MSRFERFQAGIRRYEATDVDRLIEFQRRVYPEDAPLLRPGQFAWKYLEHPRRNTEGPWFWICERDRQIVGQQGALPFSLRAAGQTIDAAWAVDLMVDPAWRLRGVGPGLNSFLVDQLEVAGGLDLSDQAYKAFLRAGWTDLGVLPLYVRPLRPAKLLAARGSGSLARLASGLMAPAVAGSARALAAASKLPGVKVEEVARFDRRLDTLWEDVSPRYPVIALRDLSTVGWRYDRCPERDRYRRVILTRNEQLLGYAVLSPGSWHDEPVMWLLDFLCRPRRLLTLFAVCAGLAIRTDAIAVLCDARIPAAAPWLTGAGFIRLDSPIRFMVHLGQTDHLHRALISDPEQWFITAFDADLGQQLEPTGNA